MRYRYSVTEYPVWGNDHAVSLYDAKLARTAKLNPNQVSMATEGAITQAIPNKVSMAFCRIGDARNLYATWIEMCLDQSLLRNDKHVDILIQDGRSQTIARNLVIFQLLEDFNASNDPDNDSLVLHTIYYTYCNQLMPSATEETLKQKFSQIIDMLEGRATFPEWLVVPVRYRQSLVIVLKAWQRQATIYTAKTIQMEVTKSYFDDVKYGRLPTLEHLGNRAVSEKLRTELSIYRRTMALFPETAFANKHEPELAAAMSDFSTLEAAQGRQIIKLREYVAGSWKVNPTWYAHDYEEYGSHINCVKPTIENIPLDFSLFVPVEKVADADRFYDYIKYFFSSAAGALRKLRKSITVTVSVGELLTKLERARYTSEATEWTTDYGFDRVNLSNLPDYIGLSPASHLFMSPLVKKHDAACTTMSSALCWPLKAPEKYDCTSTCLANTIELSKALGVEHTGFLLAGLGTIPFGRERGIFFYNTWESLQSGARSHDQLLAKNVLTTWLYGLFLKLALPSNRQPERIIPDGPPMLLHPALNLSTFFRLFVHLAEMGYPGHSLYQILISILTDNISTSARPASSQVLSVEEVTAWNTNEKQSFCTAPFFAEMSSLASMFSRVLPFAVIGSHDIVPDPATIRKCVVQFPHLPFEENSQHLAVIFTSFDFKQPSGGWGVDTIRGTILDQNYITKHKKDIIVVTTWKYDALSKTGTFWMREDIARSIDPECWMCEVYSTYTWKPICPQRAWSTYLNMTIGERWLPVTEV